MTMRKDQTIEALRGQLVVSCQAYEDNPLHGVDNMAIMSRCVLEGGAGAIRLCWPETIRAVRPFCAKPIIGINKVMPTDARDAFESVYITPTLESAIAVVEAGCDVLAMDGTLRERQQGERLEEIVEELKRRYPDLVLMADLATIEEGIACAEMGFDILASTLSGYTTETRERSEMEPDYELISALKRRTGLLVNAEGRIWNLRQLDRAWQCGADMVSIGSAITNPMKTTQYLTAHMHVPTGVAG